MGPRSAALALAIVVMGFAENTLAQQSATAASPLAADDPSLWQGTAPVRVPTAVHPPPLRVRIDQPRLRLGIGGWAFGAPLAVGLLGSFLDVGIQINDVVAVFATSGASWAVMYGMQLGGMVDLTIGGHVAIGAGLVYCAFADNSGEAVHEASPGYAFPIRLSALIGPDPRQSGRSAFLLGLAVAPGVMRLYDYHMGGYYSGSGIVGSLYIGYQLF